ncbi:MAG: MFS transporter, partial [Sphingomonas sp.]
LGAIIGGSVIQHLGLSAVGYVAAAIAILAVLVTPVVNRLKTRSIV